MSDHGEKLRTYMTWVPYPYTEEAVAALDALVALADGAAAQLQHFKECADTPLMRDVMAARDTAEARITELEADVRMAMQAHADEEADNARLREALKEIVREHTPASDAHSVARAALANEEKP